MVLVVLLGQLSQFVVVQVVEVVVVVARGGTFERPSVHIPTRRGPLGNAQEVGAFHGVVVESQVLEVGRGLHHQLAQSVQFRRHEVEDEQLAQRQGGQVLDFIARQTQHF